MAQQFPRLEEKHSAFIARQHMFFTATATAESRVNISPRSTEAFRVVDPANVLYLDRTGSGNETAAHLLADGRMTVMFCSVDGPPQIMRLYGTGRAVNWQAPEFNALIDVHFGPEVPLGTRQIVCLAVDLVQTSCGYGVPVFDYREERSAMENWHDNKGPDGIRAYWEAENVESMDGLPTGIFGSDK